MNVSRHEWNGEQPDALALTLRGLVPPLGDVSADVTEIITSVADRGDDAVLELGERLDGARPSKLPVDPAVIAGALAGLEPELREALGIAADNIRAVADAQRPGDRTQVDLPQGHRVTVGVEPVRSAGIYAPGGRAAYPSTVLMCALPARVAGVGRLALASPPGEDGLPHPLVLAAAALCEIDEVYAMGGAQAIAALAFGTAAVRPVDVIVGPGNRYVTEAKKQLFGTVGIDTLAGPTELMIILGDTAEMKLAALDICAQAEHGDEGLLVACAVQSEQLDQLADLLDSYPGSRPSIADPPVALVHVPDTDAAIALANQFAPEHLQLAVDDAELLAPQILTAGCVFLGDSSGAAFGDYAAGSNHVLPTGGAGRFTGPLSPSTFTRATATVSLPAEAARVLAPHVDALARAEGFPVHGESAKARQ